MGGCYSEPFEEDVQALRDMGDQEDEIHDRFPGVLRALVNALPKGTKKAPVPWDAELKAARALLKRLDRLKR